MYVLRLPILIIFTSILLRLSMLSNAAKFRSDTAVVVSTCQLNIRHIHMNDTPPTSYIRSRGSTSGIIYIY